MTTDTFYIEAYTLTTIEGELFLRGTGSFVGHCHTYRGVIGLLQSETFRSKHPHLIAVFKKAARMMEQGETG